MKDKKLDKRITLTQARGMMHDFYDDLESASLDALRRALHERLGVGPKRFDEIQKIYLTYLGEEAEKRTEEMMRKLKRRLNIK